MILQAVIAAVAVITTIILLKKGINIGIVMLINCIFVAAATGMTASVIGSALLKGIFSYRTIDTIIVLMIVTMIEHVMRTTGMIKQMVESLKTIIASSAAAAFIFPAILGLLPSPGGARFSCPMVEEVLGGKAGSADKAFLNYWFRHVWLDGFILYPGIILASKLTNVPAIKLFSYILVFSLIHVAIGMVLVFRQINTNRKADGQTQEKPRIRDLVEGFLPIVFVIVLYMALLNITRYSLEISAAATLLVLIIYKKYSWKESKVMLKAAFSLKYIGIIVGVMVFCEFLFSSGLVNSWADYIQLYNIPYFALFFIIPFVGGFTSGLSISFVSLAFPILTPLGMTANMWYIVISYVSGFAGVMLSPLHLCGIMSADYFGVKLRYTYKKVVVGEILMLAVVIGVFILVG